VLHVGALQSDHNRQLHVRRLLEGRDDPASDSIRPRNASEDVDENRLHSVVGYQDSEGVLYVLLTRRATHIQEVRRLAAEQLDDVHRRHGQSM